VSFQEKIRNPSCTLCPMYEEAGHVCLMGEGTRKAEIFIVGEAPGAQEDEEGRPFIGSSGRLLTKMLKEVAGIDRKDCYITNVVKCRPPDNATPGKKDIKVCVEEYLVKELERVKPKWVLTLGNSALQGVLGKSGITKHRGSQVRVGDFTVFPTFHPAAVLRNPRYEHELVADLRKFGELVRGEDHSPVTKIKIIRSGSQLRWLAKSLKAATGFTYDIETNWLPYYDPNFKIVSIAFSLRAGEAIVVPIFHKESPWKNPAQAMTILGPYMSQPKAKHVAHNGKFDAQGMKNYGIETVQTFDTMLAAHMLDENRSKGLKNLSQIYLQADAYGLGDELKDADKIPLKKLALYNGRDTDYTLRLYAKMKKELVEEPRVARVFSRLMIPASNAIVNVERRGVQIDRLRWSERSAIVATNIAKIEAAMLKYVPKHMRSDMNFNSHPKVTKWLFEECGYEVLEETEKGAPSSKEAVLLQMQDESREAAILLKYRKWFKYNSTYFRPWMERADGQGKIHPQYKLYGTVTGRLSCVEPNLQQVPREPFVRSVLGASPGNVWVEADYSQAELRIAAMLAHETRMLRMFQAGEDIHLNTAAETSGKSKDSITKEERKKAKAVNFGFLYGMMPKKFVTYARDNYGVVVSLVEATRVRERFFASYPALHPWHERQKRLAHRYKRVSSPIGRVRHLPDIDSHVDSVRMDAERQAINSPVQSLASDFTLLAMILLEEQGIPVVGLIHDALAFDIPEEKLDWALPIIKHTMENLPLKKLFDLEITVPIVTDISVGSHWSDPAQKEWNE
jgi:uracil-DNA glycosylase family 4